MTPEGLSVFDELTRELAVLARRVTVAAENVPSCQGSDSTKTVHVVLDSSGLVKDVTLDRSWRERMRTHQLGPAVMAAVSAAGQQRMADWSQAIADPPKAAPRKPVDKPRPLPSVENPALEISGLLDDLEKEIAALADGHGPLVPARVARRSPGKHVQVRLTGRQIVSVELDERWLTQANEAEIASEVRGAIQAAYQAGKQASRAARSNSALEQLKQLADPEALFRRYGLLDQDPR